MNILLIKKSCRAKRQCNKEIQHTSEGTDSTVHISIIGQLERAKEIFPWKIIDSM